ncbi:MAG: DUF3429 domain-containing protein [Pseudomonadota bacterium]|nr:DUF3429 domain-containing protein [Pseudomonadota bacterium]
MTDTDDIVAGTIPRQALWSGLAGLLPFWLPVLLAVQAAATQRSAAAEEAAFTIYAAIILGFLGGVRWGRALAPGENPPGRHWLASIAPSVLGVAAVAVHWAAGPVPAFVLVLAGLAGQYVWDRSAVERRRLPRWYGRLRTVLSASASGAAIAMIAVTLAAG